MRLLTATLLAALAGAAPAEEQPVVVELYTSQGCSACPPADAMLGELAGMEGVIALALHVDYWDYIGWPDAFAAPAFTGRQKAYARAAGERMLYTPQAVVNGQDRLVGNDPMEVMESLRAHSGAVTPVILRLSRDGESVTVEIRAEGPVPPLAIELVRYRPQARVDIAGGENAGLTVDYSNVVTLWRTVGRWEGKEPLTMTVQAPGPEPAVVLLQEEGPGRILAAAEVK